MIGRFRHTLGRLARMDRAELAWRGTAAARIAIDRVRAAVRAPQWDRRHVRSVLRRTPDVAGIHRALDGGHWIEAHRLLSRHFAGTAQRFTIAHSTKQTLVDAVRREFPHSAAQSARRADRVLAGKYDVLGYRGLRFNHDSHEGQMGRVGQVGQVRRVGQVVQDQPHPPAVPDPGDPPALPDVRDPPSPEGPPDPPRPPNPPDLSGLVGLGMPDWHVDPVHHRRAPERFWSVVPYLDPQSGDHKVIWELNRHQHWLALGRAYWLTGETRYRDRVLDELTSWMSANPPLTGINWSSMLELAFRSLSWVWALHLFVEPDNDDAAPWTVDLLLAIDRQLTQVERNLSRYFSPNTHLLGEALALYVAGRALPELAASSRREATGRRVLLAEIERQIESDGGHCERSAHYHRYALDFYNLALVVARITGDPVAADFERAVGRLAFAARLLADERGRLPHIGDDDGGALLPIAGRQPDDVRDSLSVAAALLNRRDLQIGPATEETFWMLTHPSLPNPADYLVSSPDSYLDRMGSGALPDTGYYVSRSGNGDHLVIDGGPHGYQNGGHAHADALSLTLTVRGLPLLIDPGTAGYTVDAALRDRFRSSPMHNTVMVDGRPQSVPQGPFHWSHTANGHVHRWRTNDGFDYFDGSHDGYRPLEHRRHVLALHGDTLIVADLIHTPPTLVDAGSHAAAVHWHVGRRWRVHVNGRRVTFTTRGEIVSLVVPQGQIEPFTADEETGLGWYSPAYGRVEETTAVRVSREGTGPLWMASVFDLNPENPVVDVEWVPVWAEAGALGHGAALRIERAASTDYALFAEPADPAVARAVAGPAPSLGTGREPPRPVPNATWRVGEFETDARMLFFRMDANRQVTRLALVDGSIVRGGRRRLQLALPRVAPDLHLRLNGDARVAGPSLGARLIVGGHERALALDRRSGPRS